MARRWEERLDGDRDSITLASRWWRARRWRRRRSRNPSCLSLILSYSSSGAPSQPRLFQCEHSPSTKSDMNGNIFGRSASFIITLRKFQEIILFSSFSNGGGTYMTFLFSDTPPFTFQLSCTVCTWLRELYYLACSLVQSSPAWVLPGFCLAMICKFSFSPL